MTERRRDPEALKAALLVLGQRLPEPLADDPRLAAPFLKGLEDVVFARAGVAAQVDLAIEAEDFHLASAQIQTLTLEKMCGHHSRFGGLVAAQDQRLAFQITKRVDARIGTHNKRRADVAIHIPHHESLAGVAGLSVILGMGQRGVPGNVDLLLLERIDQGIIIGIKHVIDRDAMAAEIAANAFEDRHAAGCIGYCTKPNRSLAVPGARGGRAIVAIYSGEGRAEQGRTDEHGYGQELPTHGQSPASKKLT